MMNNSTPIVLWLKTKILNGKHLTKLFISDLMLNFNHIMIYYYYFPYERASKSVYSVHGKQNTAILQHMLIVNYNAFSWGAWMILINWLNEIELLIYATGIYLIV